MHTQNMSMVCPVLGEGQILSLLSSSDTIISDSVVASLQQEESWVLSAGGEGLGSEEKPDLWKAAQLLGSDGAVMILPSCSALIFRTQ